MRSGTKIYHASRLGQPVPKPRYRCQHVKAGFLTAARIDLDKGIVDVCATCYGDYQDGRLKLTAWGEVLQ